MNYQDFIGLGVAGNFAGHLEQAGEAADFNKVITEEVSQPKAIFPFYVPNADQNYPTAFLATYPLSDTLIAFPTNNADNLQIEPEMALICDVIYKEDQVIQLIPTHFAAYNDCSIRRPGARKISEKKNWGKHSKGLSNHWLKIDTFTAGGILDNYHIACFHKRNNEINEYGIDSPINGYNYFYQKLLDWAINRMNYQPDENPMNNISSLLAQANYPKKAIISVGATRYTTFGESNFLQIGDISIVVLYNAKKYSRFQLLEMVRSENFANDISALVQKVY